MRLILAGGGNATESRPLDERLASWIGKAGRMLYLPIALPEDSPLRLGGEEWIRTVFEPLGVTHIQTWYEPDLDAARSNAARLDQFDAIYIGGGNTYRLLHVLRSYDFGRRIADFGREGAPIYGGSAGAIALGQDAGVAELAGDPDDFGDADTSGLGLADFDVLSHYTPARAAAIAARVSRTGRTVIAIPERGGWVIDGRRQYDGGFEPVQFFSVAV